MKILLNLLIIFILFSFSNSVLADDTSTTTDGSVETYSIATSTPISDGAALTFIESISNTDDTIASNIEEVGNADIVENNTVALEVLSEGGEDVSLGTYITGDITENDLWSKDKGPYYINDIYIPSDITVAVEAGTQIYVGGYIAVFGNLVLEGSMDDKVIMDLNQDYDDWYIYADQYANLDFTNVIINNIGDITTYGGYIHFKYVDYINASSGIVVNHFGDFAAENFTISGLYSGTAITLTDHSNLNIESGQIHDSEDSNYIIGGYGNSRVSITQSTLYPNLGIPIIMLGGNLALDAVVMSGGEDDCIQMIPYYDNGLVSTKAIITNTIINNFLGDGIFAIDPDLSIVDSKIENNSIGIESYARNNFNLSVANSTAVGNASGIVFGVQNESAKINFDIRNNWWGDATGPYFKGKNDSGFGDEIVGYSDSAKGAIQYDPWLATEPGKKNPVIIIPGIMGSYLNKEDGTEVWPNLTKAFLTKDSYLDDLILDNFGNADIENNIVTNDIFRTVGLFGNNTIFFDGLISKLESDGYEEGKDLFVFPYDWRLDVDDNVSGTEYSQVQSLKSKINEILVNTKSNKIDIIAHSMGGLLAKYYIEHVGTDNVDKFIDIATPHLGAPKAEKVLVYGDNMNIKFGPLGLNLDEIKKISQNFPSAYNLLPSKMYFDSSNSDYSYYIYDIGDVDADGVVGRLSFEDSQNFLRNTGRNESLIQNAELVHEDLDRFDPSDYGVDSYNIVGCGTPTIGKIFANKKQFNGDYKYALKYISGDGTVPMRSAEALPTDNVFYVTRVEHATMPSQNDISDLVVSILNGGEYIVGSGIGTDTGSCALPDGKIVSIHSPITLDIYDDSGRHTGYNEDGDIEYGIEDVTYDIVDGNKFAFIPNNIDYTIRFGATGTGIAGIDIQDYSGGMIVKSESFNNVPIDNLNTKGEVIISNGGSKVVLDRNGDGNNEVLSPDYVVDGDLPDNADHSDTEDISNHDLGSSVSGSRVATTTELDVSGFKYLSVESDNEVEQNQYNIFKNLSISDIQENQSEMPSVTPKEDIELNNKYVSQVASPAGFFSNVFNQLLESVIRLFNRIIGLFK